MSPALTAGLIIVAIAILSAVIFGIVGISGEMQHEDASSFSIEKASETYHDEGGEGQPSASEDLCVHVSGRVSNPGVCYLQKGARVADAIEAVGGPAQDARLDMLNLARILEDGEHISVPGEEDAEKAKSGESAAYQDFGSGESASAVESDVVESGNGGSGASSSSDLGKVNINTASSAQLQTLSGIGESKAGKIISYRDANGPFKSVDELTKVNGIGEKTLAAIRDAICV